MLISQILPADQMGEGIGALIATIQLGVATTCLFLAYPIACFGSQITFASGALWSVVAAIFTAIFIPTEPEPLIVLAGPNQAAASHSVMRSNEHIVGEMAKDEYTDSETRRLLEPVRPLLRPYLDDSIAG